MTTASTTATFPVSLTITLDSEGNVDWDACLASVQETVDATAQESKTIREDVTLVLRKYPHDFVQMDALVSKVVSRRQQQKAASLLATDSNYSDEDFEFTLDEISDISGKVTSFVDSNKPSEDAPDAGDSMFISRRGRGGGVQLREYAEAIIAKNEAAKSKKK